MCAGICGSRLGYTLPSRFSFAPEPSGAVAALQLVDHIHREVVETYDRGLGPQLGRHDVARLVLGLHIDDDPRLVHLVAATEIRVREEMRTGAEQQLGGTGTRGSG